MVRKRILRSLQPAVFRPPRGRKEIWLPNWSITLLRNKELPPNMAQFQVPLWASKLDMKDYLFHAYGIPALHIRSSIQQASIERRKDNKMWRPRSTKRMIVEMDSSHRGGPFAWPDEPVDKSPWDKDIYDALIKRRDAETEERLSARRHQGKKDPADLAKQVTNLMEGKQNWKPTWMERGDQHGQQGFTGTPWKAKNDKSIKEE